MNEEVKKCVSSKIDFFATYFSIPDELKNDYDSFVRNMEKLGLECSSGVEFEEKFSKSDLQERFNVLVAKCTPKTKKMTKEEKRESMKIAKDIMYDNRKELAKDAINDVSTRIINDKRDEMIKENRERMIKNGTMDDYTRMRNKVEDAKSFGNFVKNIFNKKK